MDHALAIADRIKRENMARGGGIGFTGPINGSTGGRTDARKMSVPSGSYVLPAAMVSHLGEGNTLAGQRVLGQMFKGPYGTTPSKMPRGGMGVPKPGAMKKFADGGATEAVPIYAADGEYVIPPDAVATVGGGDMQRGHDMLDEWVTMELANAAKTIKNLPGPRQR